MFTVQPSILTVMNSLVRSNMGLKSVNKQGRLCVISLDKKASLFLEALEEQFEGR